MQFGIPNQRKTKEEKYPDTPVLTLDIEGDKGTSRKIFLNESACKLLNLADDKAQIAFSFENGIFIANAGQSQIPDEYAINVTKNAPRRVSDKKTYEYIAKVLDLDTSIENEFKLSTVEIKDGAPVVFQLISLTNVTDKVDEVSQDYDGEQEVTSEGIQSDSEFSMETEATKTGV